MREMTGSRLSGPASVGPDSGRRRRGEKLGLEPDGAGSAASLVRRVGALTIDWVSAYALVVAVLGVAGTGFLGGGSIPTVASWLVPLVWGCAGTVCVALFAQTPGQALLGMGVARVDAATGVGWWRALVRVVFMLFLLPPLIQDEDGRGMHDRATGTVLIRTR